MKKHSFPLAESFNEEFFFQIEKLARLTGHGPSLGRYVELLLLRLLKKYLPGKYEFSSGFYYSQDPKCKQQVSSQLDVICYDRMNYSVLFDDEELVVVSPISVKNVIEVKSTMNKKAVEQLLKQSNCEISKQLPIDVKFNLLAVKSQLTSKSVFDFIKDYYRDNKIISRAIGIIYSLDWNEIIVFVTMNGKYEMLLLDNYDCGLSSFINQLIVDIYGPETCIATTNSIAPSLYVPKMKHVIR